MSAALLLRQVAEIAMNADAHGRWYAVIDAAQDPRLFDLIKQCSHHACLISGELDPTMARVLPWVVRFDVNEPLMQAWKVHGQGANWGIMLQSPLDLWHVKVKLKKFLNAILPDGSLVIFRFYDPRVFRTYIQAASHDERELLFQSVSRYWIESEKGGRDHDFTWRNGRLCDGTQPIN